ncbi:MAG: ribonuclease domain-containing protein [Nocardioides sp.]
MKDKRTWLGLVVAILTAVVVWWVQGDAGTTTQDPQSAPTASQSATAEPTDVPTEEVSDTPSLPSPTDTGPASEPPTGGTDPESGLPVVAAADLPPEAQDTLTLIDQGGPYPHDQDDETFQNREGILPDQPEGYYREYTVETPGSDDRGARRIVTGSGGEFYWTDDHYSSFSRIAR